MSAGGIPELGISPERIEVLAQLNRMIRDRCVHLWDFVIELENLEGVTVREKLAMMAVMALNEIESAAIARSQKRVCLLFQGLN